MDDDQAAFLNEGLPTYRTQHGMTRREILNGIANRIMYSKFYKILYFVMSVLSVISLTLSLSEACPSAAFKFLEIVVNLTMVLEVAIRLVAMGTLYWRSYSNVFDLVVVSLCVIILIPVLLGLCTRGTTIMDTILLVLRNVIQSARLFLMLRKNRRNLSARETTIDFADTRAPSMDLLDDGDVPGFGTGAVATAPRRGMSPGRTLEGVLGPSGGGYNELV